MTPLSRPTNLMDITSHVGHPIGALTSSGTNLSRSATEKTLLLSMNFRRPPEMGRAEYRRRLVTTCIQVPSDFTADRFGVPTSMESLYVDEMQAVLVELEGRDDVVISIILDTYDLHVAPFLSARAPLGCEIFPHVCNGSCLHRIGASSFTKNTW